MATVSPPAGLKWRAFLSRTFQYVLVAEAWYSCKSGTSNKFSIWNIRWYSVAMHSANMVKPSQSPQAEQDEHAGRSHLDGTSLLETCSCQIQLPYKTCIPVPGYSWAGFSCCCFTDALVEMMEPKRANSFTTLRMWPSMENVRFAACVLARNICFNADGFYGGLCSRLSVRLACGWLGVRILAATDASR